MTASTIDNLLGLGLSLLLAAYLVVVLVLPEKF